MSNEFKKRPCKNPECGEMYRPSHEDQEGCTRGCENKIKGISPVTLRSLSANPTDISRGRSGLISNRAAQRTRQRTYSR